MASTTRVLLIGIVLAGAAGWYFTREHPDTAKGASSAPPAVATARTGGGSPSSATSSQTGNASIIILPSESNQAPVRPPGTASPSSLAPALRASTISGRYETATDKRALFEELKASDSGEAKYFAAKILRDCLDVAQASFGDVQAKFMSGINPGTPHGPARVAAFKQITDPCSGFSGRKFNNNEVDQLIAEGAQKGDPRALARQLLSGQLDQSLDPIRTAAALLETGDPYVFEHVSAFLQIRSKGDLFIDGKAVDPAERGAVNFAWAFVACDYGGSCDAQSAAVLNACAYEGLCNVGSYEELISTSFAALDVYQRSLAYRAKILMALKNRDFASLGVLVQNR